MKNQNRKLPRTARRGLALMLASALSLSVPAPVSFAQAAKQTKPLLSAKKKTLYYDKAGKKAFTLKVKKNKVKMIVATKWKTSKKKIVALSRQKDMSVKLTAKKKGTATITGTIKYVPSGKWAIKTAKLTCKVTSKSIKAAAKPTAAPAQVSAVPPLQTGIPGMDRTAAPGSETPGVSAGPTVEPTAEPRGSEEPTAGPTAESTAGPTAEPTAGPTAEPTAEPTANPTDSPTTNPDASAVPDVASISVDPAEALLGTAGGRDSVVVKAVVTAKDGSEMEDAAVAWVSDDEDVAEVDEAGIVRGVSGGTANITASAGGVTSDPCVVTVDAQAPKVEGVRIPDYRTFTVWFTEPVTGTPEVYVKSEEGELIGQTVELAEDGKSMAVHCKNVLPAGSYEININGLTDMAGNQMEEDTVETVKKEPSDLTGFVCRNDRVPAGQSSFDVFYAAVDQFGQEYGDLSMLSKGELMVSAATENGMPFKSELKQDKGCITVTGPASAFVVGRKIKITLTYSVEGETKLESVMDIVVVDSANKGKPVKFGGMQVVDTKMTQIDTPESDGVRFALNDNGQDNTFRISAKFFDEFGYEADPADVIYIIEDESILTFTNRTEPNTSGINTSKDSVTVQALKGGTTKISAYLAENDTLCGEMEVTIQSTTLNKIVIEPIGEGINGRPSEAKITLLPVGNGITADQLKCEVLKGGDRVKKDSLTCLEGEDGIYVTITANTDGKDDPIEFLVSCDMGTESEADDLKSDVVTYRSTPLDTPASLEIEPFKENEVTALEKASTQYYIFNRYKEDITKREKVSQPVCQIKDSNVISSVVVGSGKDAGTLTIQAGESQGRTQLDLYMARNPEISATIDVTVAEAAYVNEVRFGELSEKDRKLPLGDEEQVLYIPITVFNQYGKEFASLTKSVAEAQIQFTVNGNQYSSAGSYLAIEWYKKNGKEYVPAGDSDITDAVAIRWNPSKKDDYKGGAGSTIRLGVESKLQKDTFINDQDENKFGINVEAARRIHSLKFAEDCKAAVAGAQITNVISIKDQYGDDYTLPEGQSIEVEISDGNGISQGITEKGVLHAEDGILKCVIQATGDYYANENGTYTIRAFVKNTTVEGSYTLIVDSAKNLIERLEIADTAKLTNGETLQLTGQCVDLRDPVSMQFDYKAFTTYNGKDVEVCLKDAGGGLVSTNNLQNSLKWNVSGKDVNAAQEAFGKWNISVLGGAETEVTVDLDYLTQKETSASRTFKASGKPSAPQHKYQIVTYDKSIGFGTENLKDSDYKAEKDPQGYLFAFRDVDQYDIPYDDISLYAVTTSNDDDVEIASGEEAGLAKNQFKVTLKESAVIGKSYTITVFVSKDKSYSFTVTAEATPVESVAIVPDTLDLSLEPGKDTGMLRVEFEPAYATNQVVNWKSEHGAVARVQADGKVTAVGAGDTEITVTTADGGKTAVCAVHVGEQLTDAQKVSSAEDIVKEVLGGINANNGITREEIQVMIDAALNASRLSDVKVTVSIVVIPATEEETGKIEVTVVITAGEVTKEDVEVPEIPITALPNAAKEKVAKAKTEIQAALGAMSVSNSTVKGDMQSTVDAVLRKLTLTGVSAVVDSWSKTDADGETGGSILATVVIKCGEEETDTVTISKIIDMLPVSDADKLAAARKVAEQVVADLTVSNATVKADIKSAVENALKGEKIEGITVVINDWAKADASSTSAGKITGTVVLTCGTKTSRVTIGKTIGQIPESDAEKVEVARSVAGKVLDGFKGNNDTEKGDITEAVEEALRSAEITGVTVAAESFVKKEATEKAAGSITGVVTLTCEDETASVWVNLTIEKLESAEPTASPTVSPSATPVATIQPTVNPGATPVATIQPTVNPGATPVATIQPTVNPGATPVATIQPTVNPGATPVATMQPTVVPASVVLTLNSQQIEQDKVLYLNKTDKTLTLSADAKDKDGNSLEDVIINWESSKSTVATVSGGEVTGIEDGDTTITATVEGTEIKEECSITVDLTPPTINSAKINETDAFVLEFSEKVTGTPNVTVTKDSVELTGVTAALTEDGTGMMVTQTGSLDAGNYILKVEGLSDLAGNDMEETEKTVEKENS